jgi:hypothetical protein
VRWVRTEKNPAAGLESGDWRLAKILSCGEASYLLTHPKIKDGAHIKMMWYPTSQEAMEAALRIEEERRGRTTNASQTNL